MKRQPLPMPADPLADYPNNWPAPIGKWSSLHAAAEALWKRAERQPRQTDAQWVLDGALAIMFDMLEEVRQKHRLAMDSTMKDVLPFVAPRVVEDGEPRLRFLVDVLDYAIEQDLKNDKGLQAAAAALKPAGAGS
jgi:hypothetical protein